MMHDKRQIWTIGAGKGGVGKSFLTASMGLVLARMGKSVLVVDGNLGSANLHTLLGIKSPGCTVRDILENRTTTAEGLIATAEPGLRLLSCSDGGLGLANPTASERAQMISFLATLDADHVLVDLGAGASRDVLDFFNFCDEGIVVATPDPASLQNAYGFIKNAIYGRIQQRLGSNEVVANALDIFTGGKVHSQHRTMMDFYDLLCTSDPKIAEKVAALVDSFQPLVVINMAVSEQDQHVAEIIQSACKKYLNVDIRFCGLIRWDPAVTSASQMMNLLDFDDEKSIALGQIRATVQRLLNSSEPNQNSDCSRPVPATPTMGLNDNLDFMGRQFHIQTEDLGYAGRCITTQVFCNGKVVLSTKSEYPATLHHLPDRNNISELMRKQHFNVIQELESKRLHLLKNTHSG